MKMRNKSGDHSKNSTSFGVLLMGGLFQNNHHQDKVNVNLARRWFEFDWTIYYHARIE